MGVVTQAINEETNGDAIIVTDGSASNGSL